MPARDPETGRFVAAAPKDSDPTPGAGEPQPPQDDDAPAGFLMQSLSLEGEIMAAPDVGTPTINTKWRLDVDTDATGETPTFIQVKGMSSFTPAVNPTVQDSTDYDAVGWGSDAVTLRKWQGQGTVMRKRYASAYDPGQEALRAAADDLSLVHCRWYERDSDGTPLDGGEAYEGYALVQWEPQGGGPEGLSTVNFTLLGQGAREVATVTLP